MKEKQAHGIDPLNNGNERESGNVATRNPGTITRLKRRFPWFKRSFLWFMILPLRGMSLPRRCFNAPERVRSMPLRELLSPHETTVMRLARRLASQPAGYREDFAQDVFLRIIKSISWLQLSLSLSRVGLPDHAQYLPDRPVPIPSRFGGSGKSRGRGRTARPGGDPPERSLPGTGDGGDPPVPPAHREAVPVQVAEEPPYEEVAEILRVSVNTTRARVHRG